jgi:hypothetical protein
VKDVSAVQRPGRGGPYHVIVIAGPRKTIRFGDGLDLQTLLECKILILQRVADVIAATPCR